MEDCPSNPEQSDILQRYIITPRKEALNKVYVSYAQKGATILQDFIVTLRD